MTISCCIEMVDTTETTTGASTQLTGRVKWFNNKAGYGFITVTGEGEFAGKDVFVHHSAIKTTDEQYKYLVQGEYVNFTLSECNDSADHEHQADSVCGMFGGKLMCETRNENRTARGSTGDDSGADGSSSSGRGPRGNRRTQGGRGSGGSGGKYTRVAVHVRGTGPRENEEWMLVRRNKRSSRGPSNNRRSSDTNSTVDDA